MDKKEYIPFTIGKQKNIALIAHDGKKRNLLIGVRKIRKYLRGIFYAEQGLPQE